MKRISAGIALFSMATALSAPSMAQDFDQLILQRAPSATPVGVQLRIPFGGVGKVKQSMRLNFGYSLKDSSGKRTFMPITGYDSAQGGFHFLGVGKSSGEGRNDQMIAYALGAAALVGIGLMAFSGKDKDQPCLDGYVKDPLSGLCTR